MKLLSIILIIISMSKVATALSLDRSDVLDIYVGIPVDPYKLMVATLLFDGMLGTICGSFILFML